MANAPKKSAVSLKRFPLGSGRGRRAACQAPSQPSEAELAAAPAAEIQQSFRSALEKGVVEFARGFRQSQDRRG